MVKRLRQPSKLLQSNSEKLDGLSEQACRRRRKETLVVCQGKLLHY